ncbi:PREDICTED: ATP-binding cassette sub-family A member 10-like [Tinamus guttatus]|uniref:ATP-binding cassette sub-family A member 10-like n=1 Tax=Tinamus guttatus TaxID=94827 RepID=UPI00052EF194|nr:PREDICTED: ATP-binding cassette sub-family A member 10-like [Tinamus guttatus]
MKRLQRNMSVFQQTKILLWKNVLVKWRMKRQSFQEWTLSLLFLPLIFLVSLFTMHTRHPEVPYTYLGQLDDPAFDTTGVTVAYTPITATTRQIMNKVALKSVMTGIKLEAMENERALEQAWISNNTIIGVVFKDNFSYRLRFSTSRLVIPNEKFGYIDTCYNFSSHYCNSPKYWYRGFLSLQSSIDAAIIEGVANHSVWEEMKSIAGIRMKSRGVISSISLEYSYLMITVVMCFSAFMHFLSMQIVKEKKKLKALMKMMGLHDIAFWLSWSLLYAVYVLVMSCLLTAITVQDAFYLSSFPAIVLLFFLYGMACVHFAFLLSSLLRTFKLVESIVFLFIFVFGSLSLAVLVENIPEPMQWFLSLFCPYAFNAGIAKIFHLEKFGIGFYFSNLMEESYFLFSTYIVLIFDSVLYLLLAIYFDKVLPGRYGIPNPPFFCLKPSYWMKSRRSSTSKRPQSEMSPEELLGDDVEPVPPEFMGKEAIRLINIKKVYKQKDKKTEALRGLFLNIYEGQITALLGHSGAGKTTLLNVLSGLTLPSEGSATIYNSNLSEMEDRKEIREMIGICPQFNVQFEVLTVKENLQTFAEIKGIKSKDVEHEVKNILELLDISNIQDTQAEKLSGGQKRKLSIAIAMLGNPQVLLLDEPTAGLDPLSRYQVWSLLKEHRRGRVILFSTQFMDEADILADRKAFISHGRLKCIGSSLFLKKKWGIGYHLRIHVSESCDLENVTALVKQHIPNAVFSGHRQYELQYKLPLENVNKFPDLFSHLDSCSDQGIINYGVHMTTLEDVFLKLEGDTTVDQEDDHAFGEDRAEAGARSLDELEQGVLLSDVVEATASGMALWRQQVCAMARVHLLTLKSSLKNLGSILLLYVVFLIPIILQMALVAAWQGVSAWELLPAQYFLPLGRKAHSETTTLLILNKTGSGIEDFIHSLERQDLTVEIRSEENITEELEHNGAIKVSREGQSYRFTVLCHMEAINCFPVLVNIISNALLRTFNSTEHIRIWSHPFFSIDARYWDYFLSFYLAYMLILFPGFPPHFSMGYLQDYKAGARSQLRISGLLPSAYWCGQALVDIPLSWLLLFSMFGLQFAMSNKVSGSAGVFCLLVMAIFGYGMSIVLLVYLISFLFRKGWNCDFWSFILIVVSLVSFVISRIVDFSVDSSISLHITPLLFPTYPLLGFVINCYYIFLEDSGITLAPPIHDVLTAVFAPYIHSVGFIFLLRYLEIKYGRPVLRKDPIFRIFPGKENRHQNSEELEEEDEDVKAERTAVRNAIASPSLDEKSVVVVSNLCKEYKIKKADSVFKKKKKMATRNVSFCVKKGEVLGLLGPNGAGKSTAIKMITGETTLTAGQVLMLKRDGASSHLQDHTPGFLGCCPQEDPLWPNLTVQEHLEAYAAVKGVRKEDVAAAVNRIVNALGLQEYLKKSTGKLSTGINRKLCFAVSMLGNPTVLLLDEVSTGMDPNGQRRVWKMIRAAVRNKEQGAILTTHYMEEAEAVCDRVAIMVSGRLRCIGSIQYLKNKFGKGYVLEIKVKDTERTDLLHAEILRIFPSAARQERFPSLLVYKVPMEDALPLSQSFTKLEEAKRTFNLEEYSFSLNTLAQVFLELSREQEKENFDLTLDGTFDWKQLQQEDS